MPGRIDPTTGDVLDVGPDIPRTLSAIRQITPPGPRCGIPISIPHPIPVSSLKGAEPTQLYVFGRHQFNCDCWKPEVV